MATTTDDVTVSIKAGGVETGPVPLGDLEQAAGELFDGATYETPLPKLHGHRPDTIKLSFAGGLDIDLMDVTHVVAVSVHSIELPEAS